MADARESRARRRATRNDLVLRKSRRRNHQAIDYGKYWLINPWTNGLVFGGELGATLEDIEDLLGQREPRFVEVHRVKVPPVEPRRVTVIRRVEP